MRTLIILCLAFLFVGSTVIAAPSERGRERGKGHQQPTATPSCETLFREVALSGTSTVDVTMQRGETLLLRRSTAFNTTEGDQRWTTQIAYFYQQPEKQLPAEWITFEPAAFCIPPGGYQIVEVWASVPQSAKRGSYFGLLEFGVCLGNACVAVGVKAYVTVE